MAEQKYEMMVLFDSADAAKSWEECEELVRGVLNNYGGRVETMDKWADRKLAYEIKKQRRATYMLLVFHVEAAKITEIDHDLRLKEKVMRHMIVRYEQPDDYEPVHHHHDLSPLAMS